MGVLPTIKIIAIWNFSDDFHISQYLKMNDIAQRVVESEVPKGGAYSS